MISPETPMGKLRNVYQILVRNPLKKPLWIATSISEYDIKMYLVRFKVCDQTEFSPNSAHLRSFVKRKVNLEAYKGSAGQRRDGLPREVTIVNRYDILQYSAGSGCHRFQSVYTGYAQQSRTKLERKCQIKTSAWRRQACSVTAPAAIAGGLPPFRKGISCSALGWLGKLNSGSRPRRQICAQKWVCVYQL
jgi:hypothetical protein